MAARLFTLTIASLAAVTSAAPAAPDIAAPPSRTRLSFPQIDGDYAPKPVRCPGGDLVRSAEGIGRAEAEFLRRRKGKADGALAEWLARQGDFGTASQPRVGLASSGGGYRALLETAGVVQAFDGREGNSSTSGLFQGLSYQSGLSGGSWFLSSFSGNNWPTVSYLRDELWAESFQAGLLLPANILKADEYPEVVVDLFAKDAAGFDNTVVDAYGRLLSYQLLKGDDGGDDIRMSGLTSLSNFTNYNVPYPIITALGVDNSYAGQCYPTLNATQYEFHPYEYGSWDAGVSAFASTEFMGTDLTNGRPTKPGKCIHHYDNIGYIFGTSSDVFPAACQTLRPDPSSGADLSNFLQSLVSRTKRPAFQDAFGIYPNPFYRLPQSRTVNTQRLLTLADGGLAGQNVPLWPLLQPARALDVIIATDNSADTPDNLPNGTEIHQTYLSARAAGLSTMPYVPPPDDFVAQNLSSRAVFFGCDSLASTVLLVWLPNVAYSFASNQPTSKVRYSRDETARMIANGNAIAEQGGQEGWSVCLACAVKAKDGLGALPPPCRACFDRYCYRGAGPV